MPSVVIRSGQGIVPAIRQEQGPGAYCTRAESSPHVPPSRGDHDEVVTTQAVCIG